MEKQQRKGDFTTMPRFGTQTEHTGKERNTDVEIPPVGHPPITRNYPVPMAEA